jgi:hypothetical protein
MPDDLQGSEEWRHTVENRLGTLEVKVNEHSNLRAAMDEDMGNQQAKYEADRKLLQALHDTQQDHTARLQKLEAGQGEIQTELRLVHVGIDTIIGLLGGDPQP